MTRFEDIPVQSPYDIYHNGVDEERCISGRIKMAWPSSQKKVEVIAVVQSQCSPSDKDPQSFKIFFELDQTYLEILDIAPNDEFHLSLKGAVLDKLTSIPRASTLPMQLVFPKGVCIQWKHIGEWKKLNTWALNGLKNNNKIDNWFISQEETAIDNEPRGLKRHCDDGNEMGNNSEPQEGHTMLIGSKKRQRREEKARKREASALKVESGHSLTCTSFVGDNHASIFDMPSIIPSSKTDEIRITDDLNQSIDSQFNSTRPGGETETSHSNDGSHHEFKAGLRSGSSMYSPLNDIKNKQIVSIIGKVRELSPPKKTRNGDWMRFVDIVDSSNYSTYAAGFKINCFTRNHEAWLPHPEVGDILILRNVKVQEYQGHLTGVGYHDKLTWAAFSPIKGEFHHGPCTAVPKQEGLAEGGQGVSFSPFFQPGPTETKYCIGLSDWWRKITTQEPSDKVIVQKVERHQRFHRLISEAGPSVPPDGYFDCTIEVLKAFNSLNNVYTIYVTDYTRNEQAIVIQTNWCHPSLSEFVVQFEMWDEAAEIAKDMHPGQYYLISNARMRINTSGYLEGKVVENKMTKLSEDDLWNVPLKALLERKRAFQAKKAKEASESLSNYQLFQDIKEHTFFHCTAELLHIEASTNGRTCLYVTDYTSNPTLANFTDQPALYGFNEHVVKILLIEEQRQIANVVEPGSFYCIRNLRLRKSPLEGFCGILGGTDKLVVKLNPKKTDNEHLNSLLRRREIWQHNNHKSRQQELRGENSAEFSSIEEVVSTRWSGQHRIRARLIDFYPLDMQDAFYQRCSQCNVEIPKTAKACFKCGDFEHEHVQYFYQLYILAEDETGHQLVVSIDDKCPLLDGIRRACIQEDHSSFRQLRDRVKPIIGNLPMVHNALKAGKCIEIENSEFYFDIESWLTPNEKKAFRLLKYECLSQ
ncbi:hypothetical protein BDN70DRAFT_996679 [Pholiota conissans]|uniref:Protection of telomeres protein 1 n=1 Tax=Pholiota conissans TaxID=109636 RepID=A0A9P6CWB4_9AGAR|nr:hypothetical protein BDN70DRAFT_996679 [Pholiota conissans]